jgi:glyoxylase-like metal-dependent hydrolase (beta-lactamase superfamily II)
MIIRARIRVGLWAFKRRRLVIAVLALLFLLLFLFDGGSSTASFAQTRREPSIQTTRIGEGFYRLYVHGFVNMVVFTGPDGALLVDTGYEPVGLIEAELEKIGITTINFIINTHAHEDHVAGNAILGRDAVIISSQTTRDLLLDDDTFPRFGLPELTFSDSLTIYFNDEEIVLYFMPGHSAGDTVVHFTKANIVCIGDHGFGSPSSVWPGTSANVYDMERSMILMTELFSSDTILVTGHESAYTMADLRSDSEMVGEAIRLVTPLIDEGLDVDQIKERDPLQMSKFLKVRENSEKWIESIVGDRREREKGQMPH